MSRPLLLEFAGALYHISSRGDGRNSIYLQDDDFELFLRILADACVRYNWNNQYHLLVETSDANLSLRMRQLNAYRSGGYTREQIGDHFGLGYSQISRLVAKYKT